MEYSMKKLIIWLAKVFNVNIVKETIVKKEVVKYRYLTNGTIKGDVCVEGNLLIDGTLQVDGGVTIIKKEE